MSEVKVLDFMGKRNIALFLSAVLLLVSVLSLATRGLNFGLDFTGGAQIELGFERSVEVELIRSTLVDAG
ncbi:protein translocase subunit SecF, partial [Reinekea forsetii]|nr:protein translocase subunit SecF [Reinekea forsetii]